MTNEASKDLPDTRGRPRNISMKKMVQRLECAYHVDALPLYYKTSTTNPLTIRRELHRFRCCYDLRDLQEELGVRFRMMPTKTGFVVTL